jgi:hypothetical protein
MLEDEIKTWLPGGAEVKITKYPIWQETEPPLVAEFQVSSPLAVSAGKRWMIPPHLFQVNEKPMFSAADRVNSVYFYYPWTEIDEIHIILPPNTDVESLPPDDEIRLAYAVYKVQQKQQPPGTIFSRRDLAMGGNVFPPDMYKEIKGFFDKTKAADDQPILIKAVAHAEGN